MYRLLPMPIKLPLISVNGVLDAAISPLDRGFTYGDGIFETCRYQSGEIPLWALHRDRLLGSASRLGIPLDESLLMAYLKPLLDKVRSSGINAAVVKIQITRGIGGRGYRVPPEVAPTYCVSVFSAESLRSANFLKGVDVRVCTQRLAANKTLAGMKHLNRLEQILARAEWQDEYAEGLLMDESGQVIEATVSNLFVVKNGQLYTPDLSLCGVAGIMRRNLIERLAPRLSLRVEVVAMTLDFVCRADELFLCNSVYGIWPVNRIVDGTNSSLLASFGQHPITHQIQSLLEQSFALVD